MFVTSINNKTLIMKKQFSSTVQEAYDYLSQNQWSQAWVLEDDDHCCLSYENGEFILEWELDGISDSITAPEKWLMSNLAHEPYESEDGDEGTAFLIEGNYYVYFDGEVIPKGDTI